MCVCVCVCACVRATAGFQSSFCEHLMEKIDPKIAIERTKEFSACQQVFSVSVVCYSFHFIMLVFLLLSE